MTLRITKTQEEFDQWLGKMQAVLSQPYPGLPTDLDYSISSLDSLEQSLLELYPDAQATREDLANPIWDWCARYIGEIIVRKGGGQWHWEGRKRNVFCHMPCVTYGPARTRLQAPATLATASTDRRKGNYISEVVSRNLETGPE